MNSVRSLFWLGWDCGIQTDGTIIENEVKNVLDKLIQDGIVEIVELNDYPTHTWTTYQLTTIVA